MFRKHFLLRQTQNTSFVMTKVCLPRQNFCRKKNSLSRQSMLVATERLSRQTRFVAASMILSRQTTRFVATNKCLSRQIRVCRNKTFVATKMILVAAPANNKAQACLDYFPRQTSASFKHHIFPLGLQNVFGKSCNLHRIILSTLLPTPPHSPAVCSG